MQPERFAIRISDRAAPLLRLGFGVTRDRAWAEIRDAQLVARFGWYEFRTPLANIARWSLDGPWRPIKAIGVRRSILHGDLTFSGTGDGGVRLELRESQRWTIFRVPELYLGLDDPEAFGAALSAAGVAGPEASGAPIGTGRSLPGRPLA